MIRPPGRSCFDGVDLREYDVEDLRKEIGVIFQDYMRYELLAKENIGFGKIEDLADQSRIEMAAHKSMAFQVIGKLPNGYDQMIGRGSMAAWTSLAANGRSSPSRGPTCAMRNC
jgi:ATP-binding cassette subfamily B protein